MTETTEQQGTRERQRVLFDAVAGRYRESRQGYPEEVVRWMVETAGLTGGAEVLEIGCGTGQLTAQLAEFRFRITASDIGPSMIDAARCQLDDSDIRFEVTSFEDIEATPASFDLIASATAFHWIDPAVAWTKSAHLLRRGGWLGILYVREEYDDPFGSKLRDAWIRRNADGGAWATAKMPTVAEIMVLTGLFDAPLERSHGERGTLRTETVMGVERTRATYLSYDAETRSSFDAELRAALDGVAEVPVEIQTHVTMAKVRSPHHEGVMSPRVCRSRRQQT